MRNPDSILDRLGRTLAHRAGVKVVVGGQVACTDGKTIRLPDLPAVLDEGSWRSVNGLLDHEAGHVIYTQIDAMPADPLLAQVLNTLEDVRVEDRYCRQYPGARENLSVAHTRAIDELRSRLDRLEPYQQRLLALLIRLDQFPMPKEMPVDAVAWTDPWQVRTQVLGAADTKALLPLAERIRDDLLAPAVGSPCPSIGIPQPQAPVQSDSLLSSTMRQRVDQLGQMPGYRPRKISRPHPLPSSDSSNLENLTKRTVPGLARRLQQAVLAETQSRWLGDQERGRIDPRRLHRLVTGTGGRVFRRLIQAERVDTAATLIVDASASMKHQIHMASAAVAVVAQSLQRLSVATEILVFSGSSLQLAKGFGESPSVLLPRLSSIAAGGGTPLGDVSLAAAKRLIHQPAQRRLMIAATDGEPDSRDHLLDVLGRCRRVGIETIGIGIGHHVDGLFPNAVYIPDIAHLAPALLRQVRGLLLNTKGTRCT